MDSTIIAAIIGALGAAVAGLLTWWLSHRDRKAEKNSALSPTEAAALRFLLHIYKQDPDAFVEADALARQLGLDADTADLALQSLRKSEFISVFKHPSKTNVPLLKLSPKGVNAAMKT
jgi:DNA-binding MarR family transcriptional regulator